MGALQVLACLRDHDGVSDERRRRRPLCLRQLTQHTAHMHVHERTGECQEWAGRAQQSTTRPRLQQYHVSEHSSAPHTGGVCACINARACNA